MTETSFKSLSLKYVVHFKLLTSGNILIYFIIYLYDFQFRLCFDSEMNFN